MHRKIFELSLNDQSGISCECEKLSVHYLHHFVFEYRLLVRIFQVFVWHTKTEPSYPPKPRDIQKLNLTVPIRKTNLLSLYAEIVMYWDPNFKQFRVNVNWERKKPLEINKLLYCTHYKLCIYFISFFVNLILHFFKFSFLICLGLWTNEMCLVFLSKCCLFSKRREEIQ